MKRSGRAGLLITVSMLIGASLAVAQGTKTQLKLGDTAPDFALPNGDGKLVTLSDYTSRGPVIVVFYRGYW